MSEKFVLRKEFMEIEIISFEEAKELGYIKRNTKLKKCPFCARTNFSYYVTPNIFLACKVRCASHGCLAEGPPMKNCDKASAEWNRRRRTRYVESMEYRKKVSGE